MRKKITNHIHKYKKINIGVRKEYYVYKCIKAGCNSYIPINQALGALCECNKCSTPMTIGKIQLYGSGGKPMARPHCINCIERRKNQNEADLAAIQTFIQGTLEK